MKFILWSPPLFMTDQLHRESVMQSVASPSATPVTMPMSTVLFLVTAIFAHTILKYAKRLIDALNAGLCALEGLMQTSTLR